MELSKYIEYKLEILKDFCIEPSGEELLKMRRCTTETQVDNICRRLLIDALED